MSRVNQLEVFLLHSALEGKRACISSFIWSQIYQMQLRDAFLPTFSAIALGFACHFEIPVPTAGMELILHAPLFFNKMRTFLKSEFEFMHYQSCQTVKAYMAFQGIDLGPLNGDEGERMEEEVACGAGHEEESQLYLIHLFLLHMSLLLSLRSLRLDILLDLML